MDKHLVCIEATRVLIVGEDSHAKCVIERSFNRLDSGSDTVYAYLLALLCYEVNRYEAAELYVDVARFLAAVTILHAFCIQFLDVGETFVHLQLVCRNVYHLRFIEGDMPIRECLADEVG